VENKPSSNREKFAPISDRKCIALSPFETELVSSFKMRKVIDYSPLQAFWYLFKQFLNQGVKLATISPETPKIAIP